MSNLLKFKIFALELKDLFDKYMLILNAPIEFKTDQNFYKATIDGDDVVITCDDDDENISFDCNELPKVTFEDVYDYTDDDDDFDPLNL